MTQNQLKYWELRWKQHYESIMLKLKAQELELELSRLHETVRHNKASERLDWADLNEKIRAAGVAEALKKESNLIDALRVNADLWYKQNQVANMLSEQQTAAAEFMISFEQAKNEDARKWLETEATLLSNGWGEYTVEKAIGEAKASMSDSRYNSVLNMFKDGGNPFLKQIAEKYSDTNELNPYPNNGKKVDTDQSFNTNVSEKMAKFNPSPVINKSKYLGPGINLSKTGTDNLVNTRGFVGPRKPMYSEPIGPQKPSGGGSAVSGVTSLSASQSASRPAVSKTPSGTTVIYSSGTRKGPGYN